MRSGIALTTAIIAFVATAAIVTLSIFGIFSNKDKENNNEVTDIKTKIQEEISEIQIPDDRDMYDFEIEPILKKYGTVKYNWLGKIKSVVLSDGTEIKIKDLYSGKIQKSSVKEQYEGGVYNVSTNIETPKLGEDMVGVYWSDGEKNSDGTYKASINSTKIEVTSDKSGFSWEDWYNYIDTSNSQNLDTKLNRWANAKSKKDGSYFVWIPRFEYKMTNEHLNKTGTITVNFISTSQTQPSTSEYKIHPAFINGNGNYDNGEWDEEISGFWVAKYEMSMEISENGNDWTSIEPGYINNSNKGNVLTSGESPSTTTTTDNTSTTTGDGSFHQYTDLTESQLKKIANLCKQEQGSIIGAQAEASLMANRFELYGKKYGTGGNGLYKYVRNSGWFAKAAHHMDNGSANDEYINAIRTVLVEGKRTLPGYIDEHVTLSRKYITSATNDGVKIDVMDRSAYVQNKTIIQQSASVGSGKYTFYCFPTDNSDPFGYTSEENRKKIGEMHYGSNVETSTTNIPSIPIRAVSKPNCYSWNYISIGNAYTNSRLYDEKNQSHMIKNSEWGAVAYLTHSQYGRNAHQINMNTYYHSIYGYSKLTGFGSSNTTSTSNLKDNKYDSVNGMNASTTGNIYGIYDMSGGNLEYTAGYFSEHENVQRNGQSMLTGASTKFVTKYPGEKASISSCYESWKDIYGDAIYETSEGTGFALSWFFNDSDIDSVENEPFILRGGSYRDGSSAGLFSFSDNEGIVYYHNNGFRVVLTP